MSFREFITNENVSFNSNRGRGSRQLLSELISMMDDDSSFKQDYYKEVLRTLIGQVKINLINDQDERVDVKVHHGRQDRLVAKKFEDNNLILPYATIYQSGVENHSERLRSHQTIIARSVWDEDKQRARRVVSLADVPVKLTYKLSVWARYLGDMDQIAASIRSKFHPDMILKTPHSSVTKAFLANEEDDGAVDARDREDRLIRKNFDIVIETFIPQPEYLITNTGKIEKFNVDIDIDAPSQTLTTIPPVLIDYSNLLDPETEWTVGTGSVGDWSDLGTTPENSRELDTNPHGDTAVIWKAINVDSLDNAYDGGVLSPEASETIDPTKTYRASFWFKYPSNASPYGNIRYQSMVNRSTIGGGVTGILLAESINTFTENEWYLVVTTIHPHTYSGAATGTAGVYEMDGTNIYSIPETKFNDVSDINTRLYHSHFNDPSDNNEEVWFWDPRLDLVDGTEPSISELIERPEYRQP